jgi:hypothetical protein
VETSDSINELAAALSKAQGKITGALKDSSNPFFKSKYADLASCWDACRVQLSENGLAVIQTTGSSDGGAAVVITTTLAHASGQWMRDSLIMVPKDSGPQAMGSCITYGRRYGLAAIVGLAQIDDDAEAAQGRANGNSQAVPDRFTKEQTAKAREYAKRIHEAFEVGMDQAVIDITAELQGDHSDDHAVYRATWGILPSGMRRQIKELVDRTPKAAQ